MHFLTAIFRAVPRLASSLALNNNSNNSNNYKQKDE